jgi:hypothetical protein
MWYACRVFLSKDGFTFSFYFSRGGGVSQGLRLELDSFFEHLVDASQ